jgi:carbonic anhydrase
MATSMTDQYLENNQRYAQCEAVHRPTHPGAQPIQPAQRVAVLACMDARLDVEDLLGLQTGDAHIIRNAGGVVTEDAFRGPLEALDSPRDPGNVERLAWDVRRGMSAILSHPWIPTSGADAVTVRGFIYDVDTGTLEQVGYPGPMGSFA